MLFFGLFAAGSATAPAAKMRMIILDGQGAEIHNVDVQPDLGKIINWESTVTIRGCITKTLKKCIRTRVNI